MRITGGKYRGKLIQTIKGQEVRPTSSKVRESIFNIIRLSEDSTVFYKGKTNMLDLFSGSGIMGLEALSRGAAKVIFVEKNPIHAEIIKKNLSRFNINTYVFVQDAFKFLSRTEEKFDFIFIDPPYCSELYAPVLEKIHERKILSENGFAILEHNAGAEFMQIFTQIMDKFGFEIYKSKTYGSVVITIIKYG